MPNQETKDPSKCRHEVVAFNYLGTFIVCEQCKAKWVIVNANGVPDYAYSNTQIQEGEKRTHPLAIHKAFI